MIKHLSLCLFFLLCFGHSVSDARHFPLPADELPKPEPRLVNGLSDNRQCRRWVDSVMQTMTLRERVGQLFVYTIAPQQDRANKELLRRMVEDYRVGGLLFSGGLLQNQVALTNEAQQMATVPLLITFDGEWGLSMRLKGTPVFPRNMVLGCIRNDSLIHAYGLEMARQCRELGVQVNFAPVADVNINPDNPVINTRSFGEDPEEVARKVVAYGSGLEAGRVLSVCKHFPGHGDTDVDSHKALPVLPFSRERLDSIELYPFRKAIRAGLGGMMVGHLDVMAVEPQRGVPSSLSQAVVSDLLIDELQFRGLVFTDALAMRGVSGNRDLCLRALKAGADLLLVPRRLKEELDAVLAAVKSGELPGKVIDEKCRKVLTYKYALGLTRRPFVRLSGLESRLDAPATRELIRQLNLAAVTVLHNRGEVLPLDLSHREVAVLNVGSADDLKPFVDELSRRVRPVVFQLKPNLPPAERKRLTASMARFKRILVCVTESRLSAYKSFFEQFAPGVPVVYLCFVPGRQVAQLGQAAAESGAAVLAHSEGADVQRQVARLVCGEAGADGRLSASIGSWFAAGCGVTLAPQAKPRYVAGEHGMDAGKLAEIDRIAEEGIRQGAYPGCQVVVLKDGKELYNKAFGTHCGDGKTGSQAVAPTDVYDLASLTKTTATLLAVMKLYDKGRISLTDYVSDYLPFLQDTDKSRITVRQLLLHESGLPSTLLFYQDAIDEDSYRGTLFKARYDVAHPVRIGSRTWANPRFGYLEGLTAPRRTSDCSWQVADSLWLNPSFKQACLQKIADTPLRSQRYRYSCVGFILLQQLVEARTGLPMDEFLQREFYGPMGLTHTGYNPLRFLKKDEIVPSSVDGFLRKDTLQGFVHDESAAFLGGVSGNAGLFSNAGEVAQIYQMLLNGGELDGKRYLSRETCRLFTTTVSRISRRGLGFDKPDKASPRRSPCAESAPASVYGHTGFTGTCAWVDPDNRLVYVFLSNRIFPDVWNNKLMRLDIRKRIQEAMYRAVR